jgi:hypothetical protein
MKAQHHWQPITSWAATLFLAGSLVISGALAAQASAKPDSSFGCVNNSFGYCGSQQFALIGAGDLVFSVQPGVKIQAGKTAVVVEPQSDSQLQDFWQENYNGVGDSKVFEYAPNGRRSGLCIADSSNKLNHPLVLNPCNYGVGQTFYPTADPLDSSVYSWSSLRGNGVISDPGNGGPGTQLKEVLFGNYDSQNVEFVSSTG